MATQGEDLADLVSSALKKFDKFKMTDLTSTITKYIGVKELLNKKKVKVSSSPTLQFHLMVNDQPNARNVGIEESDNIDIVDAVVKGEVNWRHTVSGYGYFEQELLMNREPTKILDLVTIRRQGARINWVKLAERNWWEGCLDPDDDTTPNGVPYWIVYNATDGFTGGAPFGSTVGGVNPSTYTAFKNYSATFSAITKDDLILKWKAAAYKTDFESPVEINDYDTGEGRGWYTTYNNRVGLETLYEAQNENLGLEMAPGVAAVTFMRNKVIAVPQLDTLPNSGSEPIYGIPWGVFRIKFLSGRWMKTTGPLRKAGVHNAWELFEDSTYNTCCEDRRQCVVLAKAAPYTYGS